MAEHPRPGETPAARSEPGGAAEMRHGGAAGEDPTPLEAALARLQELDAALLAAGHPQQAGPNPPTGSPERIALWATARLLCGEPSGVGVLSDPVSGVEKLAASVERNLGVDVMVASFGANAAAGLSFADNDGARFGQPQPRGSRFRAVVLNADYPRRRVARALCTSIGHTVAWPCISTDDTELADIAARGGPAAALKRSCDRFADSLQADLGFVLAECEDDPAARATLTSTTRARGGLLWHQPGRRPPGLLTSRCVDAIQDGAATVDTLADMLGCDVALLQSAAAAAT